jgi:hypothetical protein
MRGPLLALINASSAVRFANGAAARRRARGLDLPVEPWDEQDVAQARVQDGRAGEEGVRERVTQAAEAELADGALLFKEVEVATDLVAVGGGEVEPGALGGGGHSRSSSCYGTDPESTFPEREFL